MTFKRVLFHTTVLSGLTLGAADSLADDIYVDNGSPVTITTLRNVTDAWVGISNPDQYLEVIGDDGFIISTNAVIGHDATSDRNNVYVKEGGRWQQTGGFLVGLGGSDSSLYIQQGGVVTATSATIGVNDGANGNKIVVDGALGASRLDVTDEMRVGSAGKNNTMSVVDGGKTTNSFATVGYLAGSDNNVVTVSGAGSEWKTQFSSAGTGVIHIGLAGSHNQMNVLEGGSVIAEQDMLLGSNANADGNDLLIDGDGSLVTVGGALYVGRSADDNSVLVTHGGDLVTKGARIGGGTSSQDASHNNTLTVSGAGSTWTSSASIRIGDGGGGADKRSFDNKVIVEAGGEVTINGNTFIGRELEDARNQLIVRGAGSLFTTTGEIDVGNRSNSVASLLSIEDGGKVQASSVVVGTRSGINVGYGATLEATTLALSSGSTLAVAIDDARPSSIDIAGNAQLDGTLVAVISPSGLVSNRYNVLTAGIVSGQRTGEFQALVLDGASSNYSASLDYTATDVWLDFTASLGAGEKLNGNQQSVSDALNDYFNRGGKLTPEIASLYGLSGGALTDALTQATGEVGASGGVNAVELATTAFLNLMTGGGGQGAAQGGTRQAMAVMNTGVVPTADVPPAPGGWSMWGGVYGGAANMPGSSSKGSHDTDTNVGGIAAGWDYDVASETRIGLAIAGGRTNWDLDSGLGNGDSTFFQLGGYGTQQFGASYLSLAGAYAWHSMSTDRTVKVDGSERLDADFNASNLAGRIEAGHRFAAAEQLGLTPYAAFQAQGVYMPGYTENGGGFALSYQSETATALRSELGLGLDFALAADPSAARLFGRAAWAHDWTSDPTVQASFASLNMSTFTVNGAEIPADVALVTAGAELGLSEATELAATFDGEFGSGYQSYAGSLKLTYNW